MPGLSEASFNQIEEKVTKGLEAAHSIDVHIIKETEVFGASIKAVKDIKKNGLEVEWFADGSSVSRVNEKDKYTEGLFNCTSMFAVGKDKESPKNISFLSHSDTFGNMNITNIAKEYKTTRCYTHY